MKLFLFWVLFVSVWFCYSCQGVAPFNLNGLGNGFNIPPRFVNTIGSISSSSVSTRNIGGVVTSYAQSQSFGNGGIVSSSSSVTTTGNGNAGDSVTSSQSQTFQNGGQTFGESFSNPVPIPFGQPQNSGVPNNFGGKYNPIVGGDLPFGVVNPDLGTATHLQPSVSANVPSKPTNVPISQAAKDEIEDQGLVYNSIRPKQSSSQFVDFPRYNIGRQSDDNSQRISEIFRTQGQFNQFKDSDEGIYKSTDNRYSGYASDFDDAYFSETTHGKYQKSNLRNMGSGPIMQSEEIYTSDSSSSDSSSSQELSLTKRSPAIIQPPHQLSGRKQNKHTKVESTQESNTNTLDFQKLETGSSSSSLENEESLEKTEKMPSQTPSS